MSLYTTQVSLYAANKSKVTEFVADNRDVFRQNFIIADSNGQPVKNLFKLSEVYKQITRIVKAVSKFVKFVCSYAVHILC